MTKTADSQLVARIPTRLGHAMDPRTLSAFSDVETDFTALHPGALPYVGLKFVRDEMQDFYEVTRDLTRGLAKDKTLYFLNDPAYKQEQRMLSHAGLLLMNDITISMVNQDHLWGNIDYSRIIHAAVLPGCVVFVNSRSLVSSRGAITASLLEENLIFQIEKDLSAHERLETLHRLSVIANVAVQDALLVQHYLDTSRKALSQVQFAYGEMRNA